MQSNLKILFISFVALMSITVTAQNTSHVVKGKITEKVMAQVLVNKLVNNKRQQVAEFQISPANPNFMFALTGDTIANYQLQFNLLKTGTKHPEVKKTFLVSWSLDSRKDYSFTITPSKLDSTQKKGWLLQKDKKELRHALITGKLKGNNYSRVIILNEVVNGELKPMSTHSINSDGNFVIPAEINKEGFYYLVTPRWNIRTYLHPGEQVQIVIDNTTGHFYPLNPGNINQVLYRWQQLISPITAYGYSLSLYNIDNFDLSSYIRQYQELQPAMDKYIDSVQITDPVQYHSILDAMKVDRDLIPINLLFQLSAKKIGVYRATPKEFEEVPEFYRQFIDAGLFKRVSLLQVGETRQFMKLYALLNLALLPEEERKSLSKGEKLHLMINTIANDTLKSYLLKDQMDLIAINNLSEFKETIAPYKKYAKLSSAIETYNSMYRLFAGDTAYIGKSAYNFSLPDSSGKIVSMKDFKGRVILVDVWATWCGPCRGQFPFLKEIEEEYESNNNIVFVGISLDKAEVHQKWVDMIKKENLAGIQLLDDFGKAFGRKYDLAAIPRFMLIDKQGKWIEIRCPLPEAKEELKKYLDKALAE